MKFIIQKIIHKLSAIICQILPKKLKSYKLQATRDSISSVKNLSPKTYHLKPSYGFTLIETLVAISILMIAVASPLTIAQKGLSSALYAKDQITASYLAQDAIEYLRNKIDLNGTDPDKWLNGVYDKSDTSLICGTFCTVDTKSDNNGIKKCNNNLCETLQYNGIYNQDAENTNTNPSSPFTRSVKVEEVVKGVEALITVKMSWKDKGKDRYLTVSTRIFNWR